jgi:hypothetical protein
MYAVDSVQTRQIRTSKGLTVCIMAIDLISFHLVFHYFHGLQAYAANQFLIFFSINSVNFTKFYFFKLCALYYET